VISEPDSEIDIVCDQCDRITTTDLATSQTIIDYGTIIECNMNVFSKMFVDRLVIIEGKTKSK
jgi:hypothetical protein